ncbi:unnamed protein product [Kuraishia capsulata CBS 1993]|uniref:Uncharacterized protein n=1 Tax=Kuraishia capsulata CBS 1993 TaxID=1382522 RepID=W6MTV9_9ASCO|nr:uncharacterized protein KUCA_T00005937001 [Kuraishia capsulata CBS 1993]CDK29943.1 unnamed protein product [Kuraishia capsulata CBS 1993]
MSALSPAKVFLGMSAVVIPITVSAIYNRPSFSKLVKDKFEQEQEQARQQHEFTYDVYTPNNAQDGLLARYNYVPKPSN